MEKTFKKFVSRTTRPHFRRQYPTSAVETWYCHLNLCRSGFVSTRSGCPYHTRHPAQAYPQAVSTSRGIRLIRIIVHHCSEHLSFFLLVVCIVLLLSFYYWVPMYHHYVTELFVTIIMLLCIFKLLVYYYCICYYVVIIVLFCLMMFSLYK